MPRFLFTFFVILSSFIATGAASDTRINPAETSPHRVPQTSSEITIDGVLDEGAWNEALILELAYEVRPGENIPPPVRTEVLVVTRDGAVFFGFRAYDPRPAEIRAHLSDRDKIGPDDWVAVILDTFNDERRSFGLLVNPLGVQSDFVEVENGNGGSWDAIWDSAGSINDWGYSVEIRIPYSSLRFQASDGAQIWGFDAVRSYPRSARHHIGTFPRDRNINCYLCQAVKIEGFEGANPGRNLEVVPTLTAHRNDIREDVPDGEWNEGSADFEAGITARWGFTPNLTLAATINPDFSQVEADARQIDLNQPFALFYPEKRPFFQEGSDYFDTRLDVVYTRTMRDPAWGLKLTGKEGEHTVGAYVVEDEITNLLIPGNQGSSTTTLHQDSTAAVLRYKRDIGNTLTFGAIATLRESDDYHNHLIGFDADFRLSDTDEVWLEVVATDTKYPAAVAEEFDQNKEELRDWAADLLYVHNTRNLNYWARYRKFGPDFRADLGFVPRVDFQRWVVGANYTWFPDNDETWFTQLGLRSEAWQDKDHNGDLLLRTGVARFTYEGPLQSHAYLEYKTSIENYNGVDFDLGEFSMHHCMKPNGNTHVFINIITGDRIDYYGTRGGDRLRIQPGLVYDFGQHFNIDVSYLYEKMEIGSEDLYTAKISQGTFAYQFTTRTFLRAIVQYVDNEFNTNLYDDGRDPSSKDLFTELLFSYKINPRTVFFLGYSDSSIANQDYNLTQANRTIFAKVGYAFVF